MEPDTDDRDRTLWCGNLSDKVTEELLYELFVQAGPLENVKIPKDRSSGKLLSYAFVVFKHAISVPYAIALMDGICLFKKPLRLQYRSGSNSAENPYTAALEKYRQATRSSPERMPNGNTNTNSVSHQKSPPRQGQERFYANGNVNNCNMGNSSRNLEMYPQHTTWNSGYQSSNVCDSFNKGVDFAVWNALPFANNSKMRDSSQHQWVMYPQHMSWNNAYPPSNAASDSFNNGVSFDVCDTPPFGKFQNGHKNQVFSPVVQNHHWNGFSTQQTITPWRIGH